MAESSSHSKLLSRRIWLWLSLILIIASAIFDSYVIYNLYQENQALSANLTSTQQALAIIQKQKSNLDSALQDAASKNASFAAQLNDVNQTVSRLQWIQNLDPELLAKYSKVYFLSDNYVPRGLSPIDTKFLSNNKNTQTLEVEDHVLPFLQNMLQAAALDNVTIQVASAYRSFGTQASLKSSYTVTYGSGANSFSADQGYSEHQLGTALDFTTPALNGGLDGFDKTSAYTWLKDNAYKYGFILSYPPNNKYYIFEPWHWRFVGIKLATDLHTQGKNFYDLDQHIIDQYLPNIFDQN